MRFVAVLFLVAGCGSMNPVTLYRLSQLDPLTAEPTHFAVRLDLPEGLGVQPGSAALLFGAERDGERFEERLLLEVAGDVWTIAPDDQPKLRAAQARVAGWKAEGPARGHLGIDLAPCRIGEGAAPDAVASVAIRMEPNGAFLPLISEGPISEVAGDTDLRQLPACSRAALSD